jgi:hypothetical protein
MGRYKTLVSVTVPQDGELTVMARYKTLVTICHLTSRRRTYCDGPLQDAGLYLSLYLKTENLL